MLSTYSTNWSTWTLAWSLAILTALLFTPSAATQTQDSGSRQIVLEEFTRARPAPSSTTNSPSPGRKSTTTNRNAVVSAAAKLKLSHYRRVTRPLPSSAKSARAPETEIGVTIWRLRPSRPEDEPGARLLVMKGEGQTQLTPERIEADTPLKVGDRVRISIEAPRAGYLYVVDREQYADGSLGDAYLIFPTKRTRGGDNHVRPGKLIDIPAQEDNPNHFTLVPTPARSDQVGELLSIVLTPQPLAALSITEKPLQIASADLAKWERLWGAAFERFEMEGGAGLTWTKEERDAAVAKSSRYLTQGEPTPQTIYRLAAAAQGSLLVNVRLNYRNR
jgi:hypothetical protein